jgi:hypothetical protein
MAVNPSVDVNPSVLSAFLGTSSQQCLDVSHGPQSPPRGGEPIFFAIFFEVFFEDFFEDFFDVFNPFTPRSEAMIQVRTAVEVFIISDDEAKMLFA